MNKQQLIEDLKKLSDLMYGIAIDMSGTEEEHYKMHAAQLKGASNRIDTWIDGIREEICDAEDYSEKEDGGYYGCE